jgi:lipid A 4'-phosphatase
MRRRLALVLLLAFIGAVLFFLIFPNLDIAVERPFFKAKGLFLLVRSPFGDWVHFTGVPQMVRLTIIVAGVAAVSAFFGRRLFGLSLADAVFILAVFAIGPGLLANAVLKDHSGRPRPEDSAVFGGRFPYAAPLAFDGACPRNCSFVAGDPSAAFALLAPACLLPGRWRRRGILGAFFLGAAVGLVRMLQGGHYFSDVIFAGLVVAATTLALHWALFRADGAPRFQPPAWARLRF